MSDTASAPVIPWQLRKGRNTDQKAQVIVDTLLKHEVRSAVDIGCNAGLVTRAMGQAGIFAVGIEQDMNLDGVEKPLAGACLGNIRFSHDVARSLPRFDAATILSVHHHFIREMGDDSAKELIGILGRRVRKLMIFEVSSKSKEYGTEPDALFRDGSESSIVEFTTRWMADALPGWKVDYIWRNVRRPRLSDRFMFSCLHP